MNLVELDQAPPQAAPLRHGRRPRYAACGKPRPSRWSRSTWSQRSSATSSSGARTGCSAGATSRPDSVTPTRSLDRFDFAFNKKINRALVFELATARFVAQREDALLIGPPGNNSPPHASSPSAKTHSCSGHPVPARAHRPSHRPRRDPAGLSRHLPRSAHLPRRTRRGHARRHPQGLSGRADPRAPAHHRRPRHAKAAPTLPPRTCSS